MSGNKKRAERAGGSVDLLSLLCKIKIIIVWLIAEDNTKVQEAGSILQYIFGHGYYNIKVYWSHDKHYENEIIYFVRTSGNEGYRSRKLFLKITSAILK